MAQTGRKPSLLIWCTREGVCLEGRSCDMTAGIADDRAVCKESVFPGYPCFSRLQTILYV